MMRTAWRRLAIVVIVLVALSTRAYGAQFFSGEQTTLRAPVDEDTYVLGGGVAVAAPITGDLVAGGGQVAFTGTVSRDVAIGAGNATIGGVVGDDLRFVGGALVLTGTVEGDLVVFAGQVRIAPGAHIKGQMHVFAGEVIIAGRVDGPIAVQGGTVAVNGRIGGTARIIAKDNLAIGERAVFGAGISYSAPDELVVPATAVIEGDIERIPLTRAGVLSASNITVGLFGIFGALAPLQILALLIGTFFMYWLLPRFTDDVGVRAITHPIRTALIGMVFVVGGALALLFLMITIVGYLAAWLLFILYIFLILAAILWRPVVLGALIGRMLGKELDGVVTPWTIGMGVLAVALATSLPYIGVAIGAIIWMMALGSLVELGWYTLRASR